MPRYLVVNQEPDEMRQQQEAQPRREAGAGRTVQHTFASAGSEQSGASRGRARHLDVIGGFGVVFVPSYTTSTTQSCFRKTRQGGVFYRASTRNGGKDNISVFKEMNLHDFEYSQQ